VIVVQGSDPVVSLPVGGSLTYDELHAFILGTAIGQAIAATILIGLLLGIEGLTGGALVVALVYYAVALGFRRVGPDAPPGLRTIQTEPWYALGGTMIGVGVLLGGVALLLFMGHVV
jgi:hypothetical protein